MSISADKTPQRPFPDNNDQKQTNIPAERIKVPSFVPKTPYDQVQKDTGNPNRYKKGVEKPV